MLDILRTPVDFDLAARNILRRAVIRRAISLNELKPDDVAAAGAVTVSAKRARRSDTDRKDTSRLGKLHTVGSGISAGSGVSAADSPARSPAGWHRAKVDAGTAPRDTDSPPSLVTGPRKLNEAGAGSRADSPGAALQASWHRAKAEAAVAPRDTDSPKSFITGRRKVSEAGAGGRADSPGAALQAGRFRAPADVAAAPRDTDSPQSFTTGRRKVSEAGSGGPENPGAALFASRLRTRLEGAPSRDTDSPQSPAEPVDVAETQNMADTAGALQQSRSDDFFQDAGEIVFIMHDDFRPPAARVHADVWPARACRCEAAGSSGCRRDHPTCVAALPLGVRGR